MKTKKRKILRMTLIICVAVAALVVCAVFSSDSGGSYVAERSSLPNHDYGLYTFEREMTLATGETVRFYESGDGNFRYCHDSDGYVLLRDNEAATLEYAVNVGGRPVASGVSYAADESAVDTVPKMNVYDIDYEANPDLCTDYSVDEGEIYIEPPLANNAGTITNLVIYIQFAGENFTPDPAVESMFNADSGSLKSYYRAMSNNTVTINSMFPISGGVTYVYRSANTRSYYNTDGSDRQGKEAELISSAVNAAKGCFDFGAADLDVNGDGYLDSLSVIVGGVSSDTWGSLLWPHSWNLDAIDGSGSTYIDAANSIKIGEYSFNFDTALETGVLCHETGHVLGAPDLYHYDYDFVPVGNWDLMQFDNDIPQYMLTYIRDKYIGGIRDGQIRDITSNGVYSLAPVTSSGPDSVLAYRIPTSRNEYFMVEYRRATAAGFDSTLPGSGLIIYRIKEPDNFPTSLGNQNALYKGTGTRADEVYVFRPSVNMKGNETNKSVRYSLSKLDADYAYLSPNNGYFNTVGTLDGTAKYDFGNIFFSDGTNSGIVITAREISAERIEFSVQIAGAETVEDGYFDGKISLSEASFVNNAEYAGAAVEVAFGEINTDYLATLSVELADADGNVIINNTIKREDFVSAYGQGERSFLSKFVYSDKGNFVDGIFTGGVFASDAAPVKAVLRLTDADGDRSKLAELEVSSGGIAWETVLNTKTEMAALLYAAAHTTVGVSKTGVVEVSGSRTDGQWSARGVEGVVSAAAGYSHILVLFENLTVAAYGDNVYGEAAVNGWTDVKALAAGRYTSYGLRADGTVVAAGLNDQGQCEVYGWSDIVAIAAGEKHVVGLRSDGTLVAAGSDSSGECNVSSISGAKAVTCGNGFTAVLLDTGAVTVLGSFTDTSVSSWNVKKIAAGADHLLGLNADGTVVAAGDNTYGQCFVSGLYDIIDIAGGTSHSAFLRADGAVEFKGTGDPDYGTNNNIGNLVYDTYTQLTSVDSVMLGGEGGTSFTVGLGETVSLSVAYSPVTATYYRMLYTVSDPTVASVKMLTYSTAQITGLREGTTTVTVRANGSSAAPLTFTVEVRKSVEITGIAFPDPELNLPEGASLKIAAAAVPDGAEYVGDISYTSSDPSVVSVSGGIITVCGQPGQEAVITATLGNFAATCLIKVVSAAEVSLSVEVLDASPYRYGEALDMSRYTLKVTIGGATDEIHLDESMISGYDPFDVISAKQSVKVNYLGKTATFEATVCDYVTAIVTNTAPRAEYLYGSELEATSGSYDVIYASGKRDIGVAFRRSGYSGYDSEVTGMQIVTYSHTDPVWGTTVTLELEFSIMDYAVSITYAPVKTVYLYGEALDIHETATLVMASGRYKSVELVECDVRDLHTEAEEGEALYALYSLRTGVHVLEISYTESLTGKTLSCFGDITVTVLFELAVSGTEGDEEGVFYFEQNGSLGLRVALIQSTGAVEVGESGNIRYEIEEEDGSAFDASDMTERRVFLKILVATQTILGDGSASFGERELYNRSYAVCGLAPIDRIEFVEGHATEYLYGEEIDLKLNVYYAGGETAENVEPHEIVYDNNAVGEITYSARYLGHWTSVTLTVNDYCLGLKEIPDAEAEYSASGYYFPVVYSVMAFAGDTELAYGADGYSITGNGLFILGARVVTVEYSGFTETFTLTVNDVFASVTCIVPPVTEYKKGDIFDPASLYRITTKSGVMTEIPYDSVNFRYSPELNSVNVGASTFITVYYIGHGAETVAWSGYCTIPDYVTQLEIVSGSSVYEYSYGEGLSFTVRAYYAKGSVTTLSAASYSTDYNAHKIGAQTVTVSYVYKGVTYTATAEVRVTDVVKELSIVSQPTVTTYGYGDVIKWNGAVVTVNYLSGGKVTYSGDAVKTELNVSYSTLTTGSCKVTVSAGSVSKSFYITVRSADNALKATSREGIAVDNAKREVIAENAVGISEILLCFTLGAEYLSGSYRDASGNVVTEQRSVRSFDKVVYVNAEGKEVFVYTVYLKGDMNGDGAVNADDVGIIADSIASSSETGEVADYDGDGKVRLTDLVGWARKVSGEQPANAPLNDAARGFVSDIKPRSLRDEKEDAGDEE